MSKIEITVEQLRMMIGMRVRYRDTEYQVIEVLEDGPSIVLLDDQSEPAVQSNLLGLAHRRVPNTETVPVLSADRIELHPEFLALDLLG